jgi:hypothetical protein
VWGSKGVTSPLLTLALDGGEFSASVTVNILKGKFMIVIFEWCQSVLLSVTVVFLNCEV